MIKIIQDSQLPDVSLALKDEDDEPIDLTSASKVVLHLVGETVWVNGDCIVDDAINGLIHRPWLAGDTAVLGIYQLWAEIYWGSRSRIWPNSNVEFVLILPAISGSPPPPPPTRAYSVFGEVSGEYVALSSGSWVDLLKITNIGSAHQIKAFTLDLDGTPDVPVFRVVAGLTGGILNKVFPYSDSDPVVEMELILDEMISIPKEYDYVIQVYCDADNGVEAKVASLKRIELSGTEEPALTKFTEVEGSVVPLISSTWESVYTELSIANDVSIKAIKIDISGGTPLDPIFRIRVKVPGDAFEKVFPFGTSTLIISGHEFIIDELDQIPLGVDFDVQVYCTVANSASAKAYLKKIVK